MPLVLRLPQSWADRRHGSTVASPVTLADVLPTLVGAAGGRTPEGCDGRDALSVARGQAPGRDYLEAIGHVGEKPQYFAITDGRWKYIWFTEGPCEQLFDLQTDPKELRDLAGVQEFEPKRAELQARMVELHQARGSQWVSDGRMLALPPRGDSVTDRRNHNWPGYHTEFYGVDVRH